MIQPSKSVLARAIIVVKCSTSAVAVKPHQMKYNTYWCCSNTGSGAYNHSAALYLVQHNTLEGVYNHPQRCE